MSEFAAAISQRYHDDSCTTLVAQIDAELMDVRVVLAALRTTRGCWCLVGGPHNKGRKHTEACKAATKLVKRL